MSGRGSLLRAVTVGGLLAVLLTTVSVTAAASHFDDVPADHPFHGRIEHPGLLAADVLQVGHHGSNTSTGPALLSAVSPSVAVYSASATNQYGHPRTEMLDRLAAAGVEVYGTDTHGTVVITSDGQGWSITTERQPSGGDSSTGPTPPPDEEPPATSGCGPGQVDINRADIDSLQQIIHIGPDRAQQILDLRPFSSVSDMDRIDGIGPARLADIEDQGVACVG